MTVVVVVTHRDGAVVMADRRTVLHDPAQPPSEPRTGDDLTKVVRAPGECVIAVAGQAVIDVAGGKPLDLFELAVGRATSADPAQAAADVRRAFDGAAAAAQAHVPPGSGKGNVLLDTEVFTAVVVAGVANGEVEVFQVGFPPHGRCVEQHVSPFGVSVVAPREIEMGVLDAAWSAKEAPTLERAGAQLAAGVRAELPRAPYMVSYELDVAIMRRNGKVEIGDA